MSSLSSSITEQAKTCLYPRPHPDGDEEWQAVARKKNGQRPGLATALGITTDEHLGVATLRRKAAKPDHRLQRRMQQIEKMNPKEKRQALWILDAPSEREQLRATRG